MSRYFDSVLDSILTSISLQRLSWIYQAVWMICLVLLFVVKRVIHWIEKAILMRELIQYQTRSLRSPSMVAC